MIDEKKVQDWLVDEGYFKEKIYDEEANFHFIINYPADHIIDLIQPKGKNDVILVGCATEMSPEQLKFIKSSNTEKKKKYIWDIRLSLNKFLLDFNLEHPNDELERFVITDEIYDDGLTKNSLIFTIKKVFRGKLHCIWLTEKTFGSSEDSIDESERMFV